MRLPANGRHDRLEPATVQVCRIEQRCRERREIAERMATVVPVKLFRNVLLSL
jgi:hypothetical protein